MLAMDGECLGMVRIVGGAVVEDLLAAARVGFADETPLPVYVALPVVVAVAVAAVARLAVSTAFESW